MCTNPVSIPNPDFNRRGSLSQYLDTAFSRKVVPCGTCKQCLAKRQLQWVQRSLEASRDCHVLFCTNTYSDDMIKHVSVGDRVLKYVNWPDFDESLIRSARDNDLFGRPFKYLACSEYGEKRHRPHIHYLLFIESRPEDFKTYIYDLVNIWTNHMFKYWSRNISTSRKNPVRVPCSKFIRRFVRGRLQSTYDVQAVIPSVSSRRLFADYHIFQEDELNVAFYVTKYVLKYDPYISRLQQWLRLNLEPDEYSRIWSLIRPQVHTSKGFGISEATKNYIETCLADVLNDGVHHYPVYVYPDGKTAPLSRFYRDSSSRKLNHCFLSADMAKKYIDSDPNRIPGTNSHVFEPLSPTQLENIQQKFERISLQIREKSLDLDVL